MLIEGQELGALTEKELRGQRSDIAMIFQNFNLLMQKSVLDNVCFPMQIQEKKKKEARERARELLKTVGLSEKEKAYPAQLSGGQQQRVLLTRALCATRKILLLDEPVSGLDPVATADMYQIINELNKEDRVTIIMISHDIGEVATYASHVLHIGQKVFFGTKEEYLESKIGKRLVDAGEEGKA